MRQLTNDYGEIEYALAAADRVFSLMDRVVPAHSVEHKISLEKNIIFDKVSFSYVPQHPVLDIINLTLHKGERIGIVGPSGGGKSTLIDLLLGFITPTEGTIFIDGHKLTQSNSSQWRHSVGYVGQRPFLFNDTIHNNIVYGRSSVGATQINNALKAADAQDFVNKLAMAANTIVGENGNSLSGGQRQKITIARALAEQPHLIIFDEATASLDAASENEIKASLQRLPKDVTVIIVTHRSSLLEAVDRVLLVNNNCIQTVNKAQALDTVAVWSINE